MLLSCTTYMLLKYPVSKKKKKKKTIQNVDQKYLHRKQVKNVFFFFRIYKSLNDNCYLVQTINYFNCRTSLCTYLIID